MPDPDSSPGLVGDCETLLLAKASLEGRGTPLSWSLDAAVEDWDGVTVSGGRVTGLDLRSRGLMGTVPPRLAELTGLATLLLAGNTLTGCIPVELYSVANNDLSPVGDSGCRPAAPQNLRATASQAQVTLTWDAPDDSTVTGYSILRRALPAQQQFVTLVGDTGSTAAQYLDINVDPDTEYIYSVMAINAAGAGPESQPVTIRTGPVP